MFCFAQVLELLLAVVHHSYQEGEDRWKKFSRQLIDVILPLMSQLQVGDLWSDSSETLFKLARPHSFKAKGS